MTYTEFVKRTVTIFAIGIFCLGFWHLRNIFMLGFLSSIIAISLSIPVVRLQQMGLKRGPAIAITIVTMLLLITLFVAWILPTLATQMGALVSDLPEALEQATEAYNDWHIQQNSTLRRLLPRGNTENIINQLGLGDEEAQVFNVEDVTNFALPVLRGAGNIILGIVANLAIIIIVSTFMLLDPMDYARGIVMLVPPAYRKRTLEIMTELRLTVTAWMTAQLLSITITVFLVWLILGIFLGVPNALALGVIAGLMTFIPNIGSLVPLVPITIFTLADEPGKLPFVLIAYLIIQQVESNVITPSIVKRQLNIPAAVLLLFQLTSAALFGFFGILLAVPLLAVLIALVREIYVYDVLGMRGIRVDIEEVGEGKLRLITRTVDADKPRITFTDDDELVYASED